MKASVLSVPQEEQEVTLPTIKESSMLFNALQEPKSTYSSEYNKDLALLCDIEKTVILSEN